MQSDVRKYIVRSFKLYFSQGFYKISYMNFQKLFISLILFIFGLFLSSPIFAVENRWTDVVITSTHIGDICSTNITCSETAEGIYACSDTPETLTAQWMSIHQIPGGHGASYHGCIYALYIQDTIHYPTLGAIREAQEENYVYPFVRIIKIQV